MPRMFDSPIIKPGDPIPKPQMTSVPMPMRDFRVSLTKNKLFRKLHSEFVTLNSDWSWGCWCKWGKSWSFSCLVWLILFSNDLSLTQWGGSLGPSCFNLLQRTYTQINILSDTNYMLIMYIIINLTDWGMYWNFYSEVNEDVEAIINTVVYS